jgi:hypothetical protein
MNAEERAILIALSENCDPYFSYYGFEFLMKKTGLPKEWVRLACQCLRQRGYAEFMAGLWNEGGEPRGSGYTITRKGIAAMEDK